MKTIDISGFGGGYEDMCQRMLWRGVAHLAEVKPPVEMWEKARQYSNIVGIMKTEGSDLKTLESSILLPDDDCTGAMHQAVMNHLAYIHRHGTEEWLAEAAKHGREPYEWDGDLWPNGRAS